MKKERAIFLCAIFALIASAVALVEVRSNAQSPTAKPTTSQKPETKAQETPSQKPEVKAQETSLQKPEVKPQELSTDPQVATDILGNKRYLVGPGDVLDVRVFGQPDLNSTVEIDDEGNISSLPFIETPLRAMCHNEKEIQKFIAVAYGKYIKNPRISVRVVERKSRPPASVFGAVRAATRVDMRRQVRLHELLAAAGGIALNASGSIQIIHTQPDMCPQDRPDAGLIAELEESLTTTSTMEKASLAKSNTAGQATMTPVANGVAASSSFSPKTGNDKQSQTGAVSAAENNTSANPAVTVEKNTMSDIGQIQIYQTGDVRNGLGKDDPFIRPGDIVIVTEGEPIYVNGFVNAPRELVMKDGMTLGRAIAMAGGIQKTAKGNAVRVYRMEKGRVGNNVIKVDYDAIKRGAPDFLLQAYDIIDVRPSSMVSPSNLVELFKGITRGSMGNIGGSLPYRILY